MRFIRAYRDARQRLRSLPPPRRGVMPTTPASPTPPETPFAEGGIVLPAQPVASLKMPAAIWARVIAFLATKRDGDVYLKVEGGRIVGAKIIELVEIEEDSHE